MLNSIDELEKISTVSEQEYDAMQSYREAKLAQQISVMHFARMPEYKKIKFSAIHPGIVNTNLFYRNSGMLYKIAMLQTKYDTIEDPYVYEEIPLQIILDTLHYGIFYFNKIGVIVGCWQAVVVHQPGQVGAQVV